MKYRWLVSIIQFLLILLFTYAACSKLADHAMFRVQLIRFPVLGTGAAFLSWCIPLAELLTVLLLFVPRFQLTGLYASAILLTGFTLFLVLMLAVDKNLPCSCGGIIAKLSWKQHIAFNCFFILVTVAGIRLVKTQKHTLPNAQLETGNG